MTNVMCTTINTSIEHAYICVLNGRFTYFHSNYTSFFKPNCYIFFLSLEQKYNYINDKNIFLDRTFGFRCFSLFKENNKYLSFINRNA